MINKLIRGRIIEIVIVISLVLLSIPVWQSFERKISKAAITTADDYNLDFNIKKEGTKEILTVNNRYRINKKYRILLELDKEISTNEINIKINDKTYNLNDFDKQVKRNKQIYTLINNYISFVSTKYEIELITPFDSISYTYNFEESINF